ncbi:MAG: class I SAM-dependent methyltransferase, partial [Desulfobacca sp.]|uniref:class I SAM-dependent methyltransferase n=1 Tax=Desulfobacca sp. TaxID=2067990 RepID=UPI004049EA15
MIDHFSEEWTEARPAFFLEDYRTSNLSRIAQWIIAHCPEEANILDIGCSYGNLLAQLPDHWEKTGIELSNHACNVCQERLPKANIIQGSLKDIQPPTASFDVITIIDTIY